MKKSEIEKYLGKDVRLHYYWNGSKNAVTCNIVQTHYVVKFKKLDSTKVLKTRYDLIDKIELVEDMKLIYP